PTLGCFDTGIAGGIGQRMMSFGMFLKRGPEILGRTWLAAKSHREQTVKARLNPIEPLAVVITPAAFI
ncbi:unnamed protein product, partial [marine sediment metagenome]